MIIKNSTLGEIRREIRGNFPCADPYRVPHKEWNEVVKVISGVWIWEHNIRSHPMQRLIIHDVFNELFKCRRWDH